MAIVGALFAELLLDLLELLAQHDLFLRLGDLRLDVALELVAQLEALDLARHDLEQLVHATANIERREDVLPRRRGNLDECRADHVEQCRVLGETLRDDAQLVGQDRRDLHHLAEYFDEVRALRMVRGVDDRSFARQPTHPRAHVGMRLNDIDDRDALETFEHDHHGVGTGLSHLANHRGGADRVEIRARRTLGFRSRLGNDRE